MTATVDVHYVTEGPPVGPVIVLAHAIGTSSRMWQPQAESLAHDARVVRYDARGHGASPAPPGPYRISDLGADLLRLLDRLDVERASICGLSLGAMTALWVASHAPARVERVVACCVVARPSSPEAWRARAATVRNEGIEAVADLVVERWGYRDRDPIMESEVRQMLLATPAEGYAACCDAVAEMDLEPDLPALTAPTLLVAGADDPAAPVAEMERLADLMPDATTTVIADAAHLANMERPAAVTRAIARHLAPLRAKERP